MTPSCDLSYDDDQVLRDALAGFRCDYDLRSYEKLKQSSFQKLKVTTEVVYRAELYYEESGQLC